MGPPRGGQLGQAVACDSVGSLTPTIGAGQHHPSGKTIATTFANTSSFTSAAMT
jgi:hypothetical protein